MAVRQIVFGRVLVLLVLFVGGVSRAAADELTVLDDCSDASRWEAVTSDGVKLKYSVERSADDEPRDDSTARLRVCVFRLCGRAVAETGRAAAEFRDLVFRCAATCPRNNLEFKLVDESGENVWWVNRRACRVSARVDATTLRVGGISPMPGGRRRAAHQGGVDRNCRRVGRGRSRHGVDRRSHVSGAAGHEAVYEHAGRQRPSSMTPVNAGAAAAIDGDDRYRVAVGQE